MDNYLKCTFSAVVIAMNKTKMYKLIYVYVNKTLVCDVNLVITWIHKLGRKQRQS